MKRLVTSTAFAIVLMTRVPAAAQEPAKPDTKVGVFNIGTVFKKYEKAHAVQKAMTAELKPFKVQAERLKEEIDELEKVIRSPDTDANTKEEAQAKLHANKKRMGELDLEVRPIVGKRQEDQLTGLYKDIQAAVAKYAEAKGFAIVLAYGDPINGNLNFTEMNRKMKVLDEGGFVPFYVNPAHDLTAAVIDQLNADYRKENAKASSEKK